MLKPDLKLKILTIPLLLLVLSNSIHAQNRKEDQQKSKSGSEQPTFKVPVDVIVVNVTATDKQGKAVRDLTVDDFKIYEDGKLQPIHTFSLESYKTTLSADAADGVPSTDAAKESTAPAARPRMFSLVIDDIASSFDYYPTIIDALRKFVAEDLVPGDQVAIYSTSGKAQYRFTNDKQQLLAVIETLWKKLDKRAVSKSKCPDMTDLQAQMIANNRNDPDSLNVAVLETYVCMNLPADTPTNVVEGIVRSQAMQQFQESHYLNRIVIQSLNQHIRSLKHFEAQKNVILFSDGFLFEELVFELQDAVDQALRAGVVLNTVDARGLYVPMFQASDNFAGAVVSSLSHLKQRLLTDDASAQEDPLFQLAHDTGGIFLHNTNDLHAGPKAVADRETYHYVLSYAVPSLKSDGRYHKIKIEVSRPGLELTYRKGFYAPKEQMSFERRRKEDILEALHAPGNLNEIPVRLSFNYSQVDDLRYELELVTYVDIRGIPFAEEDARRKNLISLVVVATDERSRYVDGVQKDVTFNLSPSSYSELLERGFASKVLFRVPPGRYKIQAVIRESIRTKMGSLSKAIEVP